MEIALRVGESATIKRSILNTTWALGYAGLPGDSTFSLFLLGSHGAAKFSYNVFFPREQREFILPGIRFLIEQISPSSIRLHAKD